MEVINYLGIKMGAINGLFNKKKQSFKFSSKYSITIIAWASSPVLMHCFLD